MKKKIENRRRKKKRAITALEKAIAEATAKKMLDALIIHLVNFSLAYLQGRPLDEAEQKLRAALVNYSMSVKLRPIVVLSSETQLRLLVSHLYNSLLYSMQVREMTAEMRGQIMQIHVASVNTDYSVEWIRRVLGETGQGITDAAQSIVKALDKQ